MEVYAVSSVREFIECIGPMSPQLSRGARFNYIYRGQGDSRWPLLPSVFRSDNKLPCEGYLRDSLQSSYREQRALEWHALREFALEINRHGFQNFNEDLFYKLVEKDKRLKEYNEVTRMEKVWPTKDYYSLLALAQHSGMPTRLMNWTYDPFVAAYFSAKSCLNRLKSGVNVESLSLYAINANASYFSLAPSEIAEFRQIGLGGEDPNTVYHTIEVPYYFNNNIKAQKGLFICCTEFGSVKDEDFIPMTLNAYVEAELAVKEGESMDDLDVLVNLIKSSEKDSLIEFRLEAERAFELLSVLDKMHINESTLFPGTSSCVQALYDRCEVGW